jgi:hypothetical protein
MEYGIELTKTELEKHYDAHNLSFLHFFELMKLYFESEKSKEIIDKLDLIIHQTK